jgi:hypothetical protein
MNGWLLVFAVSGWCMSLLAVVAVMSLSEEVRALQRKILARQETAKQALEHASNVRLLRDRREGS